MAGELPDKPDFHAVPLFPLPNVILFPGAVLPLHIFEERYKVMTADAIRGNGVVAMALLKPGWEKDYYGRPAIEPVVCAGVILSHEKLADGTYNFLLQGLARAAIIREQAQSPYRTAELEAIVETEVDEESLSEHRRGFEMLFQQSALGRGGIGLQFRRLIDNSTTTPQIADLAAFNFLEDLALRQSLLADFDVERRVTRTLQALFQIAAEMPAAATEEARNPGVN